MVRNFSGQNSRSAHSLWFYPEYREQLKLQAVCPETKEKATLKITHEAKIKEPGSPNRRKKTSCLTPQCRRKSTLGGVQDVCLHQQNAQ